MLLCNYGGGRGVWNFDVGIFGNKTILVVQWSGSLTTNREVSGSIPGSTMGIFPYRERFPW